MKRKALPEIPTVQSSQEGINIKKEQETANDNVYEMVSLLFQYQKALDKQWSKVHIKDEDYNEKLQEYIKKKDEIDTTSENLRELLSTSRHYTNNLEDKVKQMREINGVMRVRPRIQIKQPTQTQNQKWIWPCKGSITSGYGKRKAPVPGTSEFHNGWDISVSEGTSIKAIADGKVIAVGKAKGYGNWVAHGTINGVNVTSEYGHLKSVLVAPNTFVQQGDIIGLSGGKRGMYYSGFSEGPHLHITTKIYNINYSAPMPVTPGVYLKF